MSRHQPRPARLTRRQIAARADRRAAYIAAAMFAALFVVASLVLLNPPAIAFGISATASAVSFIICALWAIGAVGTVGAAVIGCSVEVR